jgi:hypothetical protein
MDALARVRRTLDRRRDRLQRSLAVYAHRNSAYLLPLRRDRQFDIAIGATFKVRVALRTTTVPSPVSAY